MKPEGIKAWLHKSNRHTGYDITVKSWDHGIENANHAVEGRFFTIPELAARDKACEDVGYARGYADASNNAKVCTDTVEEIKRQARKEALEEAIRALAQKANDEGWAVDITFGLKIAEETLRALIDKTGE